MTVTVTGKTFELRDRLKSLGGRWNAESKGWEFHALSPALRRELATHVGVVIGERPADTPRHETLTVEEYLARILAQHSTDDETDGRYQTIIRGDDPTYFNYFADRNPKVFFGFSDLGAMTKHIECISEDMQNGSGWANGQESFCKTTCMEQALRLAINGWSEGVELADTIRQQLTGSNAVQRRRTFSVSGGSLSVGRLLASNPAHMLSRPKRDGKRIVTLFISATMMAVIKAEIAIIRAAAIAATSDILEMNGYSCEIVVVDTYHDDGKPIGQIVVKIKDAGETLNISDAIFAMGHPSFLRRFCFALIGSEHALREIWHGMGSDGVVFNDAVGPNRNEFYFDHLTIAKQRVIDDLPSDAEKASAIIKLCAGNNLPIELKDEFA